MLAFADPYRHCLVNDGLRLLRSRRCCHTEAIETQSSKPTPIFTALFVGKERDLALSGSVSPAGSCARQTSIRGALGTLVLYAADPFDSPKQIVVRKVVDSRKRLRPLADHNRFTVLTVHGLGIEEVPLSLGS
jgi:hypothetical protein